jgi:tRNA U34 5-carboxymethylaminomethyl modifying enzyme MnmG/GidA
MVFNFFSPALFCSRFRFVDSDLHHITIIPITITPITHHRSVGVLSMPDITLGQIVSIVQEEGKLTDDAALTEFAVSPLVFDTVEANSKYSNYLARQDSEMNRWRKSSAVPLPVSDSKF